MAWKGDALAGARGGGRGASTGPSWAAVGRVAVVLEPRVPGGKVGRDGREGREGKGDSRPELKGLDPCLASWGAEPPAGASAAVGF